MDTSGESVVSIVGHLVVLAMFVNVGLCMLPAERPFPWPALVFVVLIGVPSILQTWMTPVTGALARDPHATLAQGQWWRILTALGAQDGGLLAAVFNLVVIALALTFGTWIWGPWLAVALYLVPSIVLNLLAVHFDELDAPSGIVTLTFSGGGEIRLEVEALEAHLSDLGLVWETPNLPEHDLK